ncbi:DUF1080 domain-containing protein [bacterium]|nr:DUF1080 domain-containing protein [bacterium]
MAGMHRFAFTRDLRLRILVGLFTVAFVLRGITADSTNDWQSLFDGNSLKGWKVTDFAGHGEVKAKDGVLTIEMGAALCGVTYTNPVPKIDYEVSLKARKIAGGDFFCGLTVPVKDEHCTLIVGGWGGGLVGISSIDGMDASENETMSVLYFETGKWFDIRFRVTADRLTAWIDKEEVADVNIKGRRISMRPGEIEIAVPFSISTYATTAEIKDIKIRKVDPKSVTPKK